MKNVYELVCGSGSLSATLAAIAGTPAHDLAKLSAELNDGQVKQILTVASTTCLSIATREVLVRGAYLELSHVATASEDRSKLFDELLTELDISKTQASRCRQAWRCFGAILLAEPVLQQQFVAEGMKLLSETDVNDEARTEAIELARNGTKINIAVAKTIRQRHGCGKGTVEGKVNHQSGKKSKPPAFKSQPKERWSFAGKLLKIVLSPKAGKKRLEPKIMIAELRAAIAEIEKRIDRGNAGEDPFQPTSL